MQPLLCFWYNSKARNTLLLKITDKKIDEIANDAG
jgi:hypothetical protein